MTEKSNRWAWYKLYKVLKLLNDTVKGKKERERGRKEQESESEGDIQRKEKKRGREEERKRGREEEKREKEREKRETGRKEWYSRPECYKVIFLSIVLHPHGEANYGVISFDLNSIWITTNVYIAHIIHIYSSTSTSRRWRGLETTPRRDLD